MGSANDGLHHDCVNSITVLFSALASETVEYNIVHESDSSLNDEGDSYSIDDLDADSAEGGFGTSGGDSRSRYAGDSQSNFSDSYYAARRNSVEAGRPARVTGTEIRSVVQNSGIDASAVGGLRPTRSSGGGDAEGREDRRYGASPVLRSDKPGCSHENCNER